MQFVTVLASHFGYLVPKQWTVMISISFIPKEISSECAFMCTSQACMHNTSVSSYVGIYRNAVLEKIHGSGRLHVDFRCLKK